MIKIFESKILEAKYLNHNVKYLKFSVPKDFKFKAGQYLSMSILVDGKKFRNPYSIITLPSNKSNEFAEFSIKLIEHGKSFNFIKSLKEGDKIELFGPAGKFIINEGSKNNDLIFISTGMGGTPFMSMIPALLNEGFKHKIIVLKGFRNEEEILYEEEFKLLRKKYKNFEFHNVLSQPKNKDFEDKGYVQDFLEKYTPENFQGDFYLCGLKEMIKDVEKELTDKGVEKNRIFFERYN